MGRMLRFGGLALLAGSAWFLLAGEVGWLSAEIVEVWLAPLAKGGLAMLVIGFGLSLLAPVGRAMRRGHCVRCGASTERGQTFCLDHLKASLNEVQDRMRKTTEASSRHGGPA